MEGVDRRGASVSRACPGADEPLPVQRGAQPLVLDVALDHVCDRSLEEDVDELAVVIEQLLDLCAVGAPPTQVSCSGERSARADAREEALVASKAPRRRRERALRQPRGSAPGRPTARAPTRPRMGTRGAGPPDALRIRVEQARARAPPPTDAAAQPGMRMG